MKDLAEEKTILLSFCLKNRILTSGKNVILPFTANLTNQN